MEKGYKRMRKEVDGLFVATVVYDIEELEETFIQYESFGKINHHVIVTPKKRLIYSVTDKAGTTKFYDYKTDEEVEFYNKESSYKTTASATSTIYHIAMEKPSIIGSRKFAEELRKHDEKINKERYAYPIPFEIYTESTIGKAIFCDNPKIASTILLMIPTSKEMELSFDSEEVKKQLDRHVYHKKTTGKLKRK